MTRLTPSEVTRLWSKIDKGDPGECWIWNSPSVNNKGYGRFLIYRNGVQTRLLAHRLVAQLAGKQVAGLVIRHSCDTPLCCNPEHLIPGTQAQNIGDAVERGRMDTSGLALGQTYVRPARPCKTCGVTLEASRRVYCDPCKLRAMREYRDKWRRKQATRSAA